MALPDPHFSVDPVAAFLRRPLHNGIGAGVALRPEASRLAPHSVTGLRQLAAQFAWSAVLELSTSLLTESDDREDESTRSENDEEAALLPHNRLLCVAYRVLALVQTRQYGSAENAVQQLGDLSPLNPHYRYETYPALYPTDHYCAASFVPFELKFLAIEIRVQQGDASAIADGYVLKNELAREMLAANMNPDNTIGIRYGVLLSALACYHLVAQQHDAAADAARELVRHQGSTALALYMYLRVLLQVGDVENATYVLREAEKAPDSTPALHHVHSGMLLAARGRYQEALLEYDTALTKEKEEQPKTSPVSIWVHASNNAAVCLMHSGRLVEAIDRLEGALRREPDVSLQESLTFNLAAMYDLAYPQNSRDEKQVLQSLATRCGRQGFDLAMIPIQQSRK